MQPSVLRRRAGALLQNAVYNPKKLVLIHAAITIGNGFLFLATNGLYGTYLFVLLSFLAQLILAWRCQSKVLTTYGLVFETLCQQTFAPQIIRIPLDTE